MQLSSLTSKKMAICDRLWQPVQVVSLPSIQSMFGYAPVPPWQLKKKVKNINLEGSLQTRLMYFSLWALQKNPLFYKVHEQPLRITWNWNSPAAVGGPFNPAGLNTAPAPCPSRFPTLFRWQHQSRDCSLLQTQSNTISLQVHGLSLPLIVVIHHFTNSLEVC